MLLLEQSVHTLYCIKDGQSFLQLIIVTDGCQDGGREEDCLNEIEWNFPFLFKSFPWRSEDQVLTVIFWISFEWKFP